MVSVINLGTFSDFTLTAPVGINDAGQIIVNGGTSASGGNTVPHDLGLLYQDGGFSSLTPLSGSSDGQVSAINASGTIVGESYTSSTNFTNVMTATVWQNGAATQISQPGYTSGSAVGINGTGQIILAMMPSSGTTQGFIWQNGTFTSLGALGTGFTVPTAINNEGQVVGSSVSGTRQHAFLWQNGKIADLGLAGASTDYAAANAINDSGTAVGYETANGITNSAVMWTGGKALYLPGLGQSGSTANAINNAGIAVGQAKGDDFQYHAVAWYDGMAFDLNSLASSGSWTLVDATAINNHNQVVGTGVYNGVSADFEIDLPSVLTFTSAQAISNFNTSRTLITTGMSILDSAADVSASLSSLQAVAAAGKIASISFTDSGFAVLALAPAQLSADKAALSDMTGNFYIQENASAANQSFTGLSGHGNEAVFTGTAGEYKVTASGGHVTVTDSGTGRASTDTLTNVTALKFSDYTDFVAQTPGTATVTSGNITELYGAAFGRLPDVAGLAYYQAELAANPSLPLTLFAQNFLASPEYVNNLAHDYAQTVAGDTRFVDDCYVNLLHRSPSGTETAFYLNLINQITGSATPGTSAYTSALAQAHAYVVTDFSQSAEFLNDVTVTAQTPSSATHWLVLV